MRNLHNWVWTLTFTLAICACWPGHPPQAVQVALTWTAPGDDGTVGTAAEYDIRYSQDSTVLVAWGAATQATGEPAPLIAGTTQSDTLTVGNGKWYFAMRTRDEAFNWSLTSNIVSIVIDNIAPAAIVDLRIP